MKNLFIIPIIFTGFVWVASCQGKSHTEASKSAETTSAGDTQHLNTVTLTTQQVKSIGIELGHIEEKQLTVSLKTNGLLKVPNQNKASVNSVYDGIIKSLLIQPGNTVFKGQTIATVANPDFMQVQEEYLGMESKVVLAEQEYNRQKELNAGNAGALKNKQAAEATLKALLSRRSYLQQQLQLMGIHPASVQNGKLVSVLAIKSPISGIVSNVMVKIGGYVNASSPVAEIVDNSQLHLDLFVYEKDIPKLKNNQLIHFILTNNPGKEYDAQIFSLGSSFEGESKAITVHAKVKGNKSGLIDGMNITAIISLQKATFPAVPTDAIVTLSGQDYIFIQTYGPVQKKTSGIDSGTLNKRQTKEEVLTFAKIPVVKGTTDIGYTEITLLKNVPADASIVTKGAFFVLAKMTNSGKEEE